MNELRNIAKELRLTRLLTGVEKPLDVLFDYGVKLLKQDRYQEAFEIHQEALLYAELPEIHNNLAYASSRLHEYDRSIWHYRQSLKLRPNHYSTLNDLSLELLRAGQFKEGWELFEYRNIFQDGFSDRYVKGRIPRWQGEDLTGKKVFVSKEQGFGDAIQFSRYIHGLADIADHVYWYCEPALLILFQSSFLIENVTFIDNVDTVPECDYWLYQMSLPRIVEEEEIEFYLYHCCHKSPEHALPPDPVIALSWKGNSKHSNNAHRSLDLSSFNGFPPVPYVSLQKVNDNPYEVADSPLNILDIGGKIGDWHETAQVLSNTDLVITVDTALAHLAGALGTPCWVILPYYGSDWRWGPYGGQTNLYANMTLYWMPAPNTLPDKLIADLEQFIANDGEVV